MKARLIGVVASIGLTACALIAGIDDHFLLPPGDSGIDASTDGPANTDDGSTIDSDASADASIDAPPPEALAFVQQKAGASLNEKTNTQTFAIDTRSGSAIVVAINHRITPTSPSLVSITDNQGNKYVTLGPLEALSAVQYLAFAPNIVGGTKTSVTVELAAVVDEIEMYIHEYRGVAVANKFEAFSSFVDSNCAAAAQGCLKSGPFPVTSSRALIFGFVITTAASAAMPFIGRSNFNSNVTEDLFALEAGTYEVAATKVSGGQAQTIGVALTAQ